MWNNWYDFEPHFSQIRKKYRVGWFIFSLIFRYPAFQGQKFVCLQYIILQKQSTRFIKSLLRNKQ